MKNLTELTKDIYCDDMVVSDYMYSFDSYTLEDISENEIEEKLQEAIYEQEIIYSSKAMKYLSENDNSLQESLQLAHDMGYSCDNLNSETLATLLYQDTLQRALSDTVTEIMEAIETELENNTVEVINNADMSGSSYIGNITATYDDLVATFGLPIIYKNDEGDGKVQAEWHIKLANSNMIAVYDWKEYDTDYHDVTTWHIGGYRRSDYIDLCSILENK